MQKCQKADLENVFSRGPLYESHRTGLPMQEGSVRLSDCLPKEVVCMIVHSQLALHQQPHDHGGLHRGVLCQQSHSKAATAGLHRFHLPDGIL